VRIARLVRFGVVELAHNLLDAQKTQGGREYITFASNYSMSVIDFLLSIHAGGLSIVFCFIPCLM
jgi:hypothetical protein